MSSISENVDDRLSRLPQEIVSCILSLMPTKYAVRTSILSKRWRYTWMFVTSLDFDDIHPVHEQKVLSKFVDRVMDHCKSSQIQLFRLHFSNKWVKRSSVSSWIDKAVRLLNVCELDIQLIEIKLPLSLFTSKTLTKLKIGHANPGYAVWECPCSVNLPSLKTLDIAVSINPFVNAFRLISGCPMLESLSLEVTFNEEDYVFNIPTLKRLKLRLGRYEVRESVTNKVVLCVPNLEYLFVCGKLDSLFVMEDVSSLVEASVSFGISTSDHLLAELLKGISGVKSLSIEKFPCSLALPIFPNMKHFLEFTSQWHIGLILQFLESCPELKHLCIEELTGARWTEPKLVPACMLTNLTTIKSSKCVGRVLQFLEYMLGNAGVLKTVTVTWEIYFIEVEKRLCAKLFELPRASRCCEIHFHGSSPVGHA